MFVKEYFSSAKTTMCQRRMLYNLVFLLVMLTYFASNAESSFSSEMFRLVAEGHRLGNSFIYEKEVHSVIECAHLCLSEHPQCKSINYEKQKKQDYWGRRFKCQLNNKTKAMEPTKIVQDSALNYFEPVKLEHTDSLEQRQTKALLFLGENTDDYVITDDLTPSMTAFALSFWAKTEQTGNDGFFVSDATSQNINNA